jgi:hypothetical protein
MFGHDKQWKSYYHSLMQAASILSSGNVSLSGAESAEYAGFRLGEGLRGPEHRWVDVEPADYGDEEVGPLVDEDYYVPALDDSGCG